MRHLSFTQVIGGAFFLLVCMSVLTNVNSQDDSVAQNRNAAGMDKLVYC